MQSSIHASLKWQDGGTPVSKWTGLCIFSLYLEFTDLQWCQFCSYHMWVLQHHSVHAFDMSTIIVLVYLGLQIKWNQLNSNNSHHSSCIHKGSHAGKWPDLMTSKSYSVSTLGYHWTDHTGRPLEPQVHWNATGTTLADASTQWCSSGDPVLICIIGTHWKTTGVTSTLWCHWNHAGWC